MTQPAGRSELDLLIRCVRPPAAGADAPDQCDDTAADFDWTRFVELALSHGVTPLVARNAAAVFGDALPPEIADALAVNLDHIRAHNSRCTEELIDVLDALERRGIPAIPFKGPVLGTVAYGDPCWRTFRDLDFLIRESDIPAALQMLSARGYVIEIDLSPAARRALLHYLGQVMLHRPGGEAAIEPHWALAPAVLAVAFDYAGLWARARRMPFNGADIQIFSPEDLLIVLAVHGSKEGWWRLQWICDIAWLIDAHPTLDWPAVLRSARTQGCLRMVLLALALAGRLIGTGLPEIIAREIERDGVAPALAADVMAGLSEEVAGPAPLYRLTRFRFAMRERLRDRIVYVLRTIFMPREAHFRMVRLPVPLFALYYPLKLVHDYLLLPAWRGIKRIIPACGTGAASSPGGGTL